MRMTNYLIQNNKQKDKQIRGIHMSPKTEFINAFNIFLCV